jgi:hypothetical protein
MMMMQQPGMIMQGNQYAMGRGPATNSDGMMIAGALVGGLAAGMILDEIF